VNGDSIFLTAESVSVHFRKVHDRFTHSIQFIRSLAALETGGQHGMSLMDSVEGSPTEAWPASPPLQQIVQEQIGSPPSPVLLGVGLSGHGHWSIAIDLTPPHGIKFDVACKASKPPEHLGTRYRLCDKLNATHNDLDLGQRTLRFRMDPQSQWDFSLTLERGRWSLSECCGFLDIAPEPPCDRLGTHRWSYRIDAIPIDSTTQQPKLRS
jgi:hypothetical protein